MALPKQNRLGSSRAFGRVHRRGSRAATQHLAMRALKSTKRPVTFKSADGKPSALLSCEADAMVESSRFGISISRKVSKRAAVRNRIKRQLKAIIRRKLPQISQGWQVVIIVRPTAVECEFDEFLRELEYLLRKLKVMA